MVDYSTESVPAMNVILILHKPSSSKLCIVKLKFYVTPQLKGKIFVLQVFSFSKTLSTVLKLSPLPNYGKSIL